MSKPTIIGTQKDGIQGYLHELEIKSDTILVIQLSKTSDEISKQLRENMLSVLKEFLPEGRKALIIGSDVNIYEITGMDAAVLLLKGIE